MDQEIVKFGESETKHLSVQMPFKKINIAEDETFHPQICMVAIDLVSNFILAEKYTDKRDSTTWDSIISEALKGLPVELVQSVSDEARYY